MQEIDRQHRVGTGYVMYRAGRTDRQLAIGLGQRAEVYDAELAGLNMALRAATEHAQAHEEVRRIILFSDNTAAVDTIHDPLPRAGQLFAESFAHLAFHFLDADEHRSIQIAWCPEHKDVAGNEETGRLAKVRTTLEPEGQECQSRANALHVSKAQLLAEWTDQWRCSTCAGR